MLKIDGSYDLECSFCGKTKAIEKRSHYNILVNEILHNIGEEYPYTIIAQERQLVICEDCFYDNTIKELLDMEDINE